MADLADSLKPKNHHFQMPLAVVIATVAFQVAAPGSGPFRTIGTLLVIASLVVTLHAAEHTGSRRRAVGALVAVSGLMAVFGSVVDNATTVRGVGELIFALPVLFSAVAVIRWIARQPLVTGQSVLGGVLVYLLVGLMFAQVYGGIGDLASSAFFCDQGDGSQSERVYFSFITITTTGYGDYVPCTQVGRALAMSEAMFGQVYLVTIIALLVGNIGRQRSGAARADSDDQAVATED